MDRGSLTYAALLLLEFKTTNSFAFAQQFPTLTYLLVTDGHSHTSFTFLNFFVALIDPWERVPSK